MENISKNYLGEGSNYPKYTKGVMNTSDIRHKTIFFLNVSRKLKLKKHIKRYLNTYFSQNH